MVYAMLTEFKSSDEVRQFDRELEGTGPPAPGRPAPSQSPTGRASASASTGTEALMRAFGLPSQ